MGNGGGANTRCGRIYFELLEEREWQEPGNNKFLSNCTLFVNLFKYHKN